MGGFCWMSPLNFCNAVSTSSGVTCFHGATRTTAPSLSNESVSHPKSAVVLYSYYSAQPKRKDEKKKNQYRGFSVSSDNI